MVDSDTNDLRPEKFAKKVRTSLPSSGQKKSSDFLVSNSQDQGWSPHCCFKDPRKIKVGAVSEVIVLYTPAFALKPCARLWLPKTAR
ncbi:hypothetical protein ABEW05_003483 [Botrytis cinerea]